MRAKYKNQKQQLKAELDEKNRELERTQALLNSIRESNKHREEEEKKRLKKENWYDVIVYCDHCEYVSNFMIRKGVSINEAGCIRCKVKGRCHNVISYPGKFI